MLQKQVAKARGQLKKLLKLPFDSERAEDFVQAWLMLADTFVEAGKPEQAADACRRALELDASSGRAHEFLGALAEAEKRHADAARCFEASFRAEHEKSAPVGYRLASNLLKSGRAVEAVSVCAKVLALFPGYAAISELRARARGAIRP
jgi:tetratricopeptide (TPR) repeat protein